MLQTCVRISTVHTRSRRLRDAHPALPHADHKRLDSRCEDGCAIGPIKHHSSPLHAAMISKLKLYILRLAVSNDSRSTSN